MRTLKDVRSNILSLIGGGLAAMVLLIPAFSNSAYAGGGAFQNGEFNFCVSVQFNATDAQLQQIKRTFEKGSQILADATDGQHRFGTITIVNDSGASQSAEYWVHEEAGRGYATQDKYGKRGQHINMFFPTYFTEQFGPVQDGYSIAHEHAHHVYGVLDEYSGPSGAAECADLPDTEDLNFSLMDNYKTRGGRAVGSNYTLNEFCVAENHDPDGDTYQESEHGQSAWDIIASHKKRAAIAPVGLPIDEPPPAHTVMFRDGIKGLRVMLLLDRSGSMDTENRLTFAKLGANQFITFLQAEDGLGVASFSSSPSVDFPLTEQVDDSVRAAAQAAVESLSASGSTNIGDGLRTALQQITSKSTRSCDEIVVLLSDGDHNTGTPPADVIPDLQREGITALTVGLGSEISTSGEAALQNVADETGGKFFRVTDAFDLVGLFFRLAFESIGNGLLVRDPQVIATGEITEIPVFVELGTENATFVVTLADASDDIEVSLQTPSGLVITEADADANLNSNVMRGPNSVAFQVNNPEEGAWKMLVSGKAVTTGDIEVMAFADHDGVQLNVDVINSMVEFPEVIEINATPTFGGENVVGATIDGTVKRPDGSEVSIALFDDGSIRNGDAIEGDGNYSALFEDYKGGGTYTFELTVENIDGMTYSGEELFIDEGPSNSKPVPEFVRMASTTAVVTGAPDVIPAPVEVVHVSTGKPYALADAVVGALAYIDREYTITEITSGLEGGVLVRTANDDKHVETAEHLTLRVQANATVYVAYDKRWAGALPAWLAEGGWNRTGESISTAESISTTDNPASPLVVFAKDVSAGEEITLGGNQQMGGDPSPQRSHYLVVVKTQ